MLQPRNQTNEPKPQVPKPTHQIETKVGRENQNQTQDRDKPVPDSDLVENQTVPEPNTRKPPKPKTKVMNARDFKLFLENKKKERDLKLKFHNLRGKDFDSQENTPSVVSDSATLSHPFPPNPLPQSALEAKCTRKTALSAVRPTRDQKISAKNTGVPDMSGDLPLAEKLENLGD